MMTLKAFQKKKRMSIAMIMGIISVVILFAVIYVYRTYSIYQERKEFGVIKGNVPNQNYDIMFTFYLIDGNDTKIMIQTVPEEKNYDAIVSCNNGAEGRWDKESWGPVITNLNKTRTKCNITFLINHQRHINDYGIDEEIVTSGTGIYEVSHPEEEFVESFSNELTNLEIYKLKLKEYRYAGKNPNNYVTFNGEDAGWRIIGLVNTPEGQKIKLIRAKSIGEYSWDTSSATINSKQGVNEWSQAKVKTLLNEGAYYNRTNGSCFVGEDNKTTSCNFSSIGLTEIAKEMIDTVTWNTGTNGTNGYTISSTGLTKHFYNYERSRNTGKICSSGDFCTDTIARTTIWQGQVGLMYPSDYGYATSGGSIMNRDDCFNKVLYNWSKETVNDCKSNDWLWSSSYQWTMMPLGDLERSTSSRGFVMNPNGGLEDNGTRGAYSIFPVVYLKDNIRIIDGDGTQMNPYILNYS